MTTDASLPFQPPPPPDQSWPTYQVQPWAEPLRPAEPMVQPLPPPTVGRALIATFAAGFLAQLLFAFQMLGVNFPIWIVAVLAAAWYVARRRLN